MTLFPYPLMLQLKEQHFISFNEGVLTGNDDNKCMQLPVFVSR